MLTTAYTDLDFPGAEGVYAPQEDTQLLVDVMEKTGLAHGHRVGDLCTGSGVVAIAACEQGAAEVTAFDIYSRAVQSARTNAAAAGVDVDVHLGSWARAAEFGPYDLIVCNPPYVPHDPSGEGVQSRERTARRPRHAIDRAVRVRRTTSDACDAGQLRSGRRSHCLAMDSLWSRVVIARALA